MRCYETFELSFQGEAPKGSHAEVALSAVFTCGEKDWIVKGFMPEIIHIKYVFFRRQRENTLGK